MDAYPPPATRREFRVPLRVELACDQARPRFLGYAANLSVTGLFVQSARPRSPGTRLEMRLHLPGHEEGPLTCVGEVVWARGYHGFMGAAPGMGIRLVEVPPDVLQVLEQVTCN